MLSKRHPNAKKKTHHRLKVAGKNVGSTPGEKTPVGLRIIGGGLRGSKLQYSGDNRVRPMKDRTREAVFNLISVASKGKHVIDLFAGTGALAIEAISRGAVSATLVEKHLGTMKNLRQNIDSLQLTDSCRLVQADAFYLAKHPDEFSAAASFSWLVFCSPPYDFFVIKQKEMLEMLQLMYQNAPVDSVFVVESDRRFCFEQLQLPEECDLRRRTYPPAEIGVYKKAHENF
ncbi:MAG: RsmD family RNA methyltransferase [Planctomycetaceae bacterium]|jgi:16S rRNA (guanine(966)-N(2))-methyltransferase RsmD|nr:RsmD family RNA methyltransferase [Planctomycetaceae bacterium]